MVKNLFQQEGANRVETQDFVLLFVGVNIGEKINTGIGRVGLLPKIEGEDTQNNIKSGD